MSDVDDQSQGSSDAENSVTIEMFQCRKCPGQLFTSAEKDLHRKMHKEEKQRKQAQQPGTSRDSEKRKPGPLSRRGQIRASSPANSGVTLFAPAASPDQANRSRGNNDENARPKRNREQVVDPPASPASRPPTRKKIKSNKKREEAVSFVTTTGG